MLLVNSRHYNIWIFFVYGGIVEYKGTFSNVVMDFTQKTIGAYKWFHTGGCLLNHPINDIDILIVVPEKTIVDNIQNEFETKFKYTHFVRQEYAINYNLGKIDSYCVVVKLFTIDRKFDLLFVRDDSFDIMDWMTKYPLSIQKIAVDLTSGKIYKDPTQTSEKIIVNVKTQYKKFLDKYKKYYPEKIFIAMNKNYSTLSLKII